MKKESVAQLSINIDGVLWTDFRLGFTPSMQRLIIEKAIYKSLKNKGMDDNSIMPFGKYKGKKNGECAG